MHNKRVIKTMPFALAGVLALTATFAYTADAFAADNAYPNGSKAIQGSSTAATPSSRKHSPGTVGAMNNAEKGSFTASKAAQKKEHF